MADYSAETYTTRQTVAAGVTNSYTDSLFTGVSSADNGGALNVEATGKVIVTGSTFSANTAADSGTTPNSGGGAYFAKYTSGSATTKQRSTFSNCLFTGNTAGSNGGGLYIGHSCYMRIDGTTFSNNYSASGDGGAIYAGRSGLTSSSTYNVVDANTASKGDGGGIYFYSTGSLNGSWTITNNFADNGGGLCGSGGTLTISASARLTFTGNTAGTNGGAIFDNYKITANTGAQIVVKDNFAGGNGGGLYFTAVSSGATNKASTINNGTFSGNVALGDGGAIYANATKGSSATAAGYLAISGSTFSGNTADAGGAIYNAGTLSIKDSVFEGNQAESGGAIRNEASAVLTINGCEFLTSSDSINSAGTLTLLGTNTFAATLYSGNSITATGSTLNFTNTKKIKVTGALTFDESATGNIVNINGSDIEFVNQTQLANATFNFNNTADITVTGALTGLSKINFNGETVKFATDQNFSDSTLNINCQLAGGVYRIARGTLGTDTFFVTASGNFVTLENNKGKVEGTDYWLVRDVDDGNCLLLSQHNDRESKNLNCVTIVADVVEAYDHDISLREAAVTYAAQKDTTNVTFDSDLNGQEIDFSGKVIELATDSTWIGNGYENTLLKGSITNTCGAVLDIRKVAFQNKERSGHGGAVKNEQSTVNFTEVKFSGNTANSENNGGAVAYRGGTNDGSYTATIYNSSFCNNYAGGKGGAVYAESGYTLTIDFCTFIDNSAGGKGGAIYANGALTIKESAFSTAKDTIYVNGTLTLTGSNWFGADIYAKNAVTVTEGSTIYFNNLETITVDADLSFGNSASIIFEGKTVEFAQSQDFSGVAISINFDLSKYLTQNQVIASGKFTFAAEQTFNVGGKTVKLGEKIDGTDYTLRYVGDYLLISPQGADEPASNCVTITSDAVDAKDYQYSLREAALTYQEASGVTAVTFADNLDTVKLSKILILAAGGTWSIQGNANGTTISGRINNNGVLDIQGASDDDAIVFTGNKTTVSGTAIYSTGESAELTVKNVKFTGNSAAKHGGAVYVSATPTVVNASTISDCVFSGNTADSSGGALYSGDKNGMMVADSTFTGNTAGDKGGAIYLGNQSSTEGELRNLTVTGNTAGNSGGGLYTSVITARNLTITDNFAGGSGGGVHGAYFHAYNCMITGNTAGNHGGGIYSAYRLDVMTDTRIEGNCAGGNGGGAYVSKIWQEGTKNLNSVVSGGTFTGNRAGGSGGGLFMNVYCSTSTAMRASVSDAIFDGNTAGEFGGALYNSGKVAISKTYFVSNLAGYGGAIYSTNSYGLQIDGSTFTANTASNRGGALYNRSGATISNSLFAGNIAERGGAIFNDGGNALLITGSIFTANTATGNNAGALFLNGASQADIIASTFTGNVAENSSGAISLGGNAKAAAHAVINISTCSFDGNQAQQGTGLLLNGAYKDVTVEHCSFTGNSARGTGAVAYVYTETVVAAFNTCSFENNVSAGSGGGVSVNAGTVSFDNCTFAGNVSENGVGGALYIKNNSSNRVVTIKDSKFETLADTIYNNGGTLIFEGSNEFAADVYSTNAIDVTKCTAITLDHACITIDSGTQDFSGVNLNVKYDIPAVTETITVASGDFTFGATQTVSVTLGDAAAQDVLINGTFTVENNEYLLSYSAESKKLEIRFNAAAADTTGSVTSGTAVKDSTGETTGYAAEWIDTTTVSSGKQIFAGSGLDTLDGTLIIDGTDLSGKMIFGGSNADNAESGTKTIQFKSGTAGSLLAGGMTNGSDGNTVLEIAGGTVTNAVYAGARNITGNTEVNVTGGIAGQQVYGGVLNADVAGDITVNLQAGTMVGSAGGNLISGGNRITGGSHSIGGEISVNVSGSFDVGTAETNLYGAGMAIASGAALTTGDINIDISGGNLGEAKAGRGVFGGGFADKGSVTSQNVTIDLTSGSFGNVFGGGWAQQGGSSTVNSVEILVSGDVTGSNIYGGGAHSNNPAYTSNTAVGSVAITITDNTNLTSVFAGGQYNQKGTDTVTGTAAITVSGTYANGFTTNLYGGGYYGVDTVAGTSTLDLQNFTGSMKNIIGDFDKVVFSGDSEVNFSSAELNNQQHNGWEFDFTGRTADKAAKTAAVFDDVFGSFSLLTNADLLNADSWQLLSANVSCFDDDWAMDISYDGGAAQSVKLGGEINLGGTDWELKSLDTNDPSGESDGTRLVMLSKKTTL